MLPRKLLSSSARLLGHEIVPRYLTERDEPWLCALIERYRLAAGKPRRELRALLARPLDVPAPNNKRRIAAFALERMTGDAVVSPVAPELLRSALFQAASRRRAPRSVLVAEVAAAFELEAAALESGLFADLDGERQVEALAQPLSAVALAQEANFLIASGLVRRASRLSIRAAGETRALVRHAQLRGLICSAAPDVADASDASDAVRLEVSGPFALFRHTQVYARALGSLLPPLTWCREFELVAECPTRGSNLSLSFRLQSGDPIGVGRPLKDAGSAVEQRFSRDFLRATSDWNLIPQPPARAIGSRLVFADFEIVHRQVPARRYLLEIVGYWTPEYLQQKLACISGGTDGAAIDAPALLLCIDESKACTFSDLPVGAHLVPFKRRIDVRAVIRLLEAGSASAIAEFEQAR